MWMRCAETNFPSAVRGKAHLDILFNREGQETLFERAEDTIMKMLTDQVVQQADSNFCGSAVD